MLELNSQIHFFMVRWELQGELSFEIWIYGGVQQPPRNDNTIFWIYKIAFYKDFGAHFSYDAAFFVNWEFDTMDADHRKQKIQIQSTFFLIREFSTGRGESSTGFVWRSGEECGMMWAVKRAITSHVILRCLRQRVGDGYNDTDERKVVSYVKREFESNSEGKGLVTGGAGRQGERGAADYFKMGAGIIGSGLGSVDCLVGGFGNAGEHTAGGTCDGSGVEAGRSESHRRETGSHQLTVGTEKKCETKSDPRDPDHTMCRHRCGLCSTYGVGQSVLKLGLQRPGNRRYRSGASYIGMVVCSDRTFDFHCRRRGSFFDAEEGVGYN